MSYWDKASERDHVGQTWHPLVYHCLDVAACIFYPTSAIKMTAANIIFGRFGD